MSAEDLGRRLLGETVETETLDELLRSLQSLHQQTHRWTPFHIPPLDALVREHTRSNHESSSTTTTTTNPKRIKPVFLELSSPAPSQGKTHLLYYITALAILPTHWPFTTTTSNNNDATTTSTASIRTPLNGKHSTVIILDTDARFSAHRLATLLSTHIASCFRSAQKPPPPSDLLRCVVKEALMHVHIFRPASLESWIATIAGLPSYLENSHGGSSSGDGDGDGQCEGGGSAAAAAATTTTTTTTTPKPHHSSPRPLHSILLDSATAFYWPVKADEEAAKLAVQRPGMPRPVMASDMYARLTRVLGSVSRRFCCLVVSTAWAVPIGGLGHGGGGGGGGGGEEERRGCLALRPVLPPLWVNAQMVRLGVRRVPVVPFRAGMSVEAAEEEDGRRMKVVGRSRFEVWVLGEGDSEGSGFRFRIGDEGVEIDSG